MENYRKRKPVASIPSLVSDKCDLKGRRIKRDKLFLTTVNRESPEASKVSMKRRNTHTYTHFIYKLFIVIKITRLKK